MYDRLLFFYKKLIINIVKVKHYLKVFTVNLSVAAGLSFISMWILGDKTIAKGFIIGNLCRCVGIFSIIKTSGMLLRSGKPRISVIGLYILRLGILVFVGILQAWGGRKIKQADPSVAHTGAVLFFK